ncbi:AAA domain-containing protein [Verrucomicrobium sp. GAS474]|uniref:AAA family ATPase n=1 Tax=Verrucomicrobium sp. GAS474 TaxID=1882831 RepID=UPI000879BC52|nr:AAA family ATPase [Verrucomicrobium sp. GAS474]SDU29111.1 AAA domain-containing protein [Verrucomicrobium sp. GAS474]
MIHFPIFERLEVKNYGLYPGTKKQPGIDIHFKSGLTLILGANGLGKTTLITIIYRMLAGAYDLPQTTLDGTELGGSSLEIKPLSAQDKAQFASRVQDVAANATATLTFSIGKKQLTIQRQLNNLNLISFQGQGVGPIKEEATYQQLLPNFSGLPNFGDWLLLLRLMVFYFEDRRELVWDKSAQRHIFRTLFLPAEEADTWYKQERALLTLDSRYRNDTAALNRLKKRVNDGEKAVGDVTSLRAELDTLLSLQENDDRKHGELATQADDLDSRRHGLRRDLLQAELEVDKSARILEHEKLELLKNHFPSEKNTSLYLYSVLIAQNHCAVCGHEAKSTADELSERITNLKCVVCKHDLDPTPSDKNIVSFSKEKVKLLREKLEQDKQRVSALRDQLKDTSDQYDRTADQLIQIRAEIAERGKQINRIENALPKDNKAVAKDKSQLSELTKALNADKAELSKRAGDLKTLIVQANSRISSYSTAIKEAFANYAEGFLTEKVHLKWSPVSEKLGQTGITKINFPAFDLEMSGSNFTMPVPRSGPSAVSESQREFIDLAFRMALVKVAGGNLGGSLIIDAPESSLDAFFVKKAAKVLCRFGSPDSKNRLIVASNLIDGQLLPEMIKGGIPLTEQTERLVDLLKIAVPTAALRENRAEYEGDLKKILRAGGLRE